MRPDTYHAKARYFIFSLPLLFCISSTKMSSALYVLHTLNPTRNSVSSFCYTRPHASVLRLHQTKSRAETAQDAVTAKLL
ncbi:hypothetical protein C7974DRAFT_400198 [Boeremia exigua]|uniref:uncharacterized protein n=1 Tax=Boeremia exigua TaxID=749465 RepID=UPI001E8CE9AD|nr:uncharacterized protein C7974DRAFT_400198 [Boeremia exigua]KAH6618491.1 hypothetical protein C7974DRAFT_400198 [Boeremia exigua]